MHSAKTRATGIVSAPCSSMISWSKTNVSARRISSKGKSHPQLVYNFRFLFVFQFERGNGQLCGHDHWLPECITLRRAAIQENEGGWGAYRGASRQLQIAHCRYRETIFLARSKRLNAAWDKQPLQHTQTTKRSRTKHEKIDYLRKNRERELWQIIHYAKINVCI